MFRRLRGMLFAAVIAVLVIGAACGFLMQQGKWNDVVALYGEVFGVEVGDAIDKYGHGANDLYNGARDYAGGVVNDIKSGTYRDVNWPDLSNVLGDIKPIPKNEARHPKYVRSEFGPDWPDVDGNGCDTRNDILRRDLENVKLDSDGCTVLSGSFHDPYTGKDIDFTRGQKTSSAVQIDHVVPLSLAWQLGAWSWDADKRRAFANDPDNLFASDGPTNGSKGDSPISEWMPPNAGFGCTYTAAYTHIIDKYDLAMSDVDQAKVADMIGACS